MNRKVIVGTYGLNNELNINEEKMQVVAIASLKQFIKAGWLNNLDVLIVNGKGLGRELAINLDQALDKIDICVVSLGNNPYLTSASYGLAYDSDNEKELSNGIVDFISNNLWDYKTSNELNINEEELVSLGEPMEDEIFKIMKSLIDFIGSKDEYTKHHCERVAKYAYLLAEGAGLTSIEKDKIYKAALIHDVGKIGISSNVLKKKERLSDDEFHIIQQHSQIADELLSKRFFSKLKPIVRGHHERFDGRGYPDNLKGQEIPVEARILGIANAFDAMTTKRGYNKPKNLDEAISELERNSGSQFDPELVPIFIEVLKKIDNDLEKAGEFEEKKLAM